MHSKTWLAPGPLHTLRAGALTMDVAPAAGGRIASLASAGKGGRRSKKTESTAAEKDAE